jgi:hypothetical protein
MRYVWALGLSSLLVSGCLGPFRDSGSAVADDIRLAGSPIVLRVEYAAEGWFSAPAVVAITVSDDATLDQIHSLYCDLVMPAIRARGAPDELQVDAWQAGRGVGTRDSYRCPTP